MAYPPPTLPINRTNALPQQDTHPQDHNTANAAVNDTVARLGPNPQGTFGRAGPTVQDSMDRVVVRNIIRGVAEDGMLRVDASSVVVTGDANGIAFITFSYAFANLPIVVASMGDAAGSIGYFVELHNAATTLTGFQVRARRGDTGLSPASTAMRIEYIAIGTV